MRQWFFHSEFHTAKSMSVQVTRIAKTDSEQDVAKIALDLALTGRQRESLLEAGKISSCLPRAECWNPRDRQTWMWILEM